MSETSSFTSIRGEILGKRPRRKPKIHGNGEVRICTEDGCDTRLSQYNKNEECYHHAPKRFPRLRGEFT